MMSDSSVLEVMRLLTSQLAAFLGLLLVAAAVHKAVRWKHTEKVAHEFAGVSRSAAAGAALTAALAELIAGGSLFVPAGRLIGALLAAVIWGLYLVLIVRALVHGRRDVDCGCSFAATRHRLGAFEVTRNTVLVVLALLVAASSASGAVPVPAAQLLAGCALLALYGALDQVMALQPLRTGEVQ